MKAELRSSLNASLPPRVGSGHDIYKYWWVGSGPIRLTTIFCLFVGHAVNEINEVWQQISRKEVVGTERKLAILILLYITSKTGELWPKGPPRVPKFISG